MKVLGYILLVIGAMLLVSGVRLAATHYDFQNTDHINQFLGGLVFAVLVLAGGVALINRSKSA